LGPLDNYLPWPLSILMVSIGLGLVGAVPIVGIVLGLWQGVRNSSEEEPEINLFVTVWLCLGWLIVGVVVLVLMPDYQMKRLLGLAIIWTTIPLVCWLFWRRKFKIG